MTIATTVRFSLIETLQAQAVRQTFEDMLEFLPEGTNEETALVSCVTGECFTVGEVKRMCGMLSALEHSMAFEVTPMPTEG